MNSVVSSPCDQPKHKCHYSVGLQIAKQPVTTSKNVIEFACHLKGNRDKLALINRLCGTVKRAKDWPCDNHSFVRENRSTRWIPPAVAIRTRSGRENFIRSRNQSDCRICWIPPAHELKKGKIPFSRAPKIVLYKFSAKIRCCLFMTSSSTYVPRPRVPTFFASHVLESTLPRHAPGFPHPRIPSSPRLRVPRPRVLSPQILRPRLTFSHSQPGVIPQLLCLLLLIFLDP